MRRGDRWCMGLWGACRRRRLSHEGGRRRGRRGVEMGGRGVRGGTGCRRLMIRLLRGIIRCRGKLVGEGGEREWDVRDIVV